MHDHDEVKLRPGTPEGDAAADDVMARIAWIREHGSITGFHAARCDAQMNDGTRPRLLGVGALLDARLQEPRPVLRDFVDLGSKLGIYGPSKARKSFLALQLAVELSAGRQFLAWEPTGRYKVAVLQFEIPAAHYRKRVTKMLHSLGIKRDDVVDHLFIMNGRGSGLDLTKPDDVRFLIQVLKEKGVQVVVIDPAYKVFPGDECSAQDVGKFLAALDVIANETEALIAYCHHFAKGAAGDRQTIDRGSGSGVWARDFDAALFCSPQKDTEDTLVIEPVARAYPPTDDFCVEFKDGRFIASNAPPIVQSSKDRRGDKRSVDDIVPLVVNVLRGKRMKRGDLEKAVRFECSTPVQLTKESIDAAKARDLIDYTPGFHNVKMYRVVGESSAELDSGDDENGAI